MWEGQRSRKLFRHRSGHVQGPNGTEMESRHSKARGGNHVRGQVVRNQAVVGWMWSAYRTRGRVLLEGHKESSEAGE